LKKELLDKCVEEEDDEEEERDQYQMISSVIDQIEKEQTKLEDQERQVVPGDDEKYVTFLKETFGFDSFLEGQREALKNILVK